MGGWVSLQPRSSQVAAGSASKLPFQGRAKARYHPHGPDPAAQPFGVFLHRTNGGRARVLQQLVHDLAARSLRPASGNPPIPPHRRADVAGTISQRSAVAADEPWSGACRACGSATGTRTGRSIASGAGRACAWAWIARKRTRGRWRAGPPGSWPRRWPSRPAPPGPDGVARRCVPAAPPPRSAASRPSLCLLVLCACWFSHPGAMSTKRL